mmetsp:Transcript_36/g.60  ORF Transcript_36/g.60 Transcript_36/m.60 type:complete len:200 (-) Transcript_36:312-911(-)
MAMEFTDDLVNDVTKMVELARKRRQYSSSTNKTMKSLVRENNHNSAANNRRRHSTMSTDIWINTIDNKSFTERTDRTHSTIHSDSEDDDEEINRVKLRRGRRSRTNQGLTSSDSVCSEESSVSRPSTSTTRHPLNPERTKSIRGKGKSKCRSRGIGKNINDKETRNNATAEYRAPDLENERRCCLKLPKQFRMYDPEIF